MASSGAGVGLAGSSHSKWNRQGQTVVAPCPVACPQRRDSRGGCDRRRCRLRRFPVHHFELKRRVSPWPRFSLSTGFKARVFGELPGAAVASRREQTRTRQRPPLPMNLVAADVRRLHLNSPRTIRASSRRLLRLRGFNARNYIWEKSLPGACHYSQLCAAVLRIPKGFRPKAQRCHAERGYAGFNARRLQRQRRCAIMGGRNPAGVVPSGER
jgi:hypothetical protein